MIAIRKFHRGLFSAALLASSVAPLRAQLSAADKSFVTKAVQGNNYEIAAARLALTRASDPAVKAYAQMMIDDHTNLASHVKAAVGSADPQFNLPSGTDGTDQAQLDALRNSGKRFDSVYKTQMIASHTQVHALFQHYVDDPKSNAGLKAVISDALPTVQKHHDAATSLPVT